MPCITELRNLFYPEQSSQKTIPFNIYDLLTPAALAHLIMGDGAVQKHGITLCTDSYYLSDVIRLMNVLIIRYRLKCTLHYHTPTQPRIYISERSMPLLRTIVRSHICSSMAYKLKLGQKAHYTTEASFYINIKKSPTATLGYVVVLRFELVQHSRDELLMISLIEFFKCGNVRSYKEAIFFRVEKLSDIINIIIPFFNQHHIKGVKFKYFQD
jgi:hypothetical protein